MMIQGNMKKRFVLVALVFVMVAAVEVWGIKVSSAAPPAKPMKLRMMMPGEPSGGGPLGGFHGDNTLAEPVVFNVMEPLIDYTKDGPVPKLATKWEHSADLTKWRFYLRRGVKFHNGADFTARDVVEFAKWIIEIKEHGYLWGRLPIKEAVAIDNYTVDLIFANPQPLLPLRSRIFLIPPASVSRDNRETYKTTVVGTGPYRFVEWNRGLGIKMTKFEGYWGPKPQIDNVEIVFRGEEAIRLAALIAREVDWAFGLSPESARGAPKYEYMPSPETVWIMFDQMVQKEPIFADKRLRLAIDHAIDRQALVSIYEGFATPSPGQFASPGDFGFNPSLNARPYDLKKARTLVREAGAEGKTITFVAPSGRYDKDREVAEALAYMIDKTGLKVKLMLVPKEEVSKYKRVGDKDHVADIVFTPSDAFLEVESRYNNMFVQGGSNCSFEDSEATRLYKEALAETNFAKRGEKLGKAWAYVYEHAYYLPVFKMGMTWGLAKNLEWKRDIAGRPFISDMRFTD